MVRDIVARALARIELLQAAVEIAQYPLRPRPVRQLGFLAQRDSEHIGNRALLDDEAPAHVGLAEFKLGVEENRHLGGARGETDGHRLARAVAERQDGAARGGNLERTSPDKCLE